MSETIQRSDISNRTLEHFGRAMLLVQYLEVAIISAYLLLEVVPTKRHLIEQQEEWVEEVFKQANAMLDRTLGSMIHKLCVTGKVAPEAQAVLQTALEARNRLSHGFFLGRPLTQSTTRSDLDIYKDLEVLIVAICKAAELLETSLDKMRRVLGLEEMHMAPAYARIRSHYDYAP